MTPLPFASIYFVFAAGYFMSYTFRVVNAVMAPDLTRELSLHPSDIERVLASIERHRLTGEPLQEQYRIRRKDGEFHLFFTSLRLYGFIC